LTARPSPKPLSGAGSGGHGASPAERQGGTWPAERAPEATPASGSLRDGSRSRSGAWQRPTQGGSGARRDQQRLARDAAWGVLSSAKAEWVTRRRRSDGNTVPAGPSFDRPSFNKDAATALAAAEAASYAATAADALLVSGHAKKGAFLEAQAARTNGQGAHGHVQQSSASESRSRDVVRTREITAQPIDHSLSLSLYLCLISASAPPVHPCPRAYF
jgi:hypothetical protein